MLAERAVQGAESFTVRPTFPLYLPGERWSEVLWNGFGQNLVNLRVKNCRVSAGATLSDRARGGSDASAVNAGIVAKHRRKRDCTSSIAQLLEERKSTRYLPIWLLIRDLDYLKSGRKSRQQTILSSMGTVAC